ncbi:hypothetical protein [Streptomyces pseudogriseolus]|uniref:hypothetical protein n=1 Tax=Streptomyces pseudogriseolus TaxID=36817 RepID=UPI000A3C3E12
MSADTRAAAITALARYSALVGPSEMHEPLNWQASDLMTDLLLGFDPATADLILHRVRRDYDAEHRDIPPVLPPAC